MGSFLVAIVIAIFAMIVVSRIARVVPQQQAWIVERLGRYNRIVRYDARGTGLSDRGAVDFSLEARVRDLTAVVDHLELGRFDILAGAHASPTAIAYATTHLQRVHHLVLVGGYARGSDFRSLPRFKALDSLREILDDRDE